MGAGYAFLVGPPTQGHVPVPGGTSHTEALLKAMAEILSRFPGDIELEIELTHRLWVLSCSHFGSTSLDLQKAMDFLEPFLIGLVSKEVATEVKKGLLNRRASTKFSMCQDAGRYMTKENSRMRPAGEVAAMRVEAVKNGSFVLHRAVGQDGQMENDDLLEVRWPGIAGKRCMVFQDRLRDITHEEMLKLQAWAEALIALIPLKSSAFDPLSLAAEDPGMFWSCVRHALIKAWPEALRQGREEAWKLRAKVSDAAGSTDLEFPGQEREPVAMAALVQILEQIPKLPQHQSGLEVQIIGNQGEKGSVEAMNQMEAFMKLPKQEQEKIVAKESAMKAKHEQKQAKRLEQGKPGADCKLIGQERCCWSCGNVEEHPGRKLCQCAFCRGYLCSAPSCRSIHSGLCFGRDAEPECEDDLSHAGTVQCVVLPVDQRIKPYARPLPKSKAAADRALQKILRAECFTALMPLRAFQHGWSDPLDDGSRISQKGLYLLQADWTRGLKGSEASIYGLTSTSGVKLNGQKGQLGAYHPDRDRWEVLLAGQQQAKLLKPINLRCSSGLVPPQNLRASTILTSLFDNTAFSGHPMAIPGPVDNRVVFGDEELAVPARGDVWVVRADGDFHSAAVLNSFSFTDFELLWGIFQQMSVPAAVGTPFFMGTVMRKTPEYETLLGQSMGAALFGDEVDDSDEEDRDFLETWDWCHAEAEEEPVPLVGARVQIHGLETAQQYNGADGRVVAPAGDRFKVYLESFDKTISISPKNMWLSRQAQALDEPPQTVDSLPASPSERAPGSELFIAPCDLFFCQDTISSKFRSGVSIRETLDQLLSREIRKRDVEMMRITIHEGRPYCLSNRRLALYRLLQLAARCRRVKVHIVTPGAEFHRKFTTKCQGEKVVIRETAEVVGRASADTTFQHTALRPKMITAFFLVFWISACDFQSVGRLTELKG
ncbi:CIPK25 [Symbiodinium sp. CCMP2592]|nr:CIPK25 [Symbiodinium sp. CCMP2592]